MFKIITFKSFIFFILLEFVLFKSGALNPRLVCLGLKTALITWKHWVGTINQARVRREAAAQYELQHQHPRMKMYGPFYTSWPSQRANHV